MAQKLTCTMTQQQAFDGDVAQIIELKNHAGMTITLMDIGATWLSCRVPLENQETREVLLGVATMADFRKQFSYMGVTVGRYANRIAKGRFTMDDVQYQLSINQAGNCLHGGEDGFDKRRWQIQSQSSQHVTFSLLSGDGDQGFAGNLQVAVTYTLSNDNQVQIEYQAVTDKATPVNLTNHAYFNLLGVVEHTATRQQENKSCLTHRLKITADHFLPTTEDGIPLGELASVDGTGFDFRQEKAISKHFLHDEQQKPAKGYDHSYFFNSERDINEPVAQLISPDEKIRLSVITNKPAMQLYTGNWLNGTPNRKGGEYQDYAGIALETQFLPDSPNHPDWAQPSCILHPDQEYRFFTYYQFTS